MNFNAVRQAGGTNVIMSGKIVEFKGEGVGRTGKPWKKIVAEDMDGEKHNVTVRGRLPDANALNKPAQFTISVFDGRTQQGESYVGYSGFCDLLPNYGQPTAQAPSPALRRTPQPAQSEMYPRPDSGTTQGQPPPKPDWDLINLGKCRFGLYQATIQAGCSPEALDADAKLLMALESLAKKCMHGIGGMPNPDYVGGEGAGPDDGDIPF